jgi:hypothetical protein
MKTKQSAMKLSQICRRTGLCLRKIILRFEMYLSNLLFSWLLNSYSYFKASTEVLSNWAVEKSEINGVHIKFLKILMVDFPLIWYQVHKNRTIHFLYIKFGHYTLDTLMRDLKIFETAFTGRAVSFQSRGIISSIHVSYFAYVNICNMKMFFFNRNLFQLLHYTCLVLYDPQKNSTTIRNLSKMHAA